MYKEQLVKGGINTLDDIRNLNEKKLKELGLEEGECE